MMSPAVKLPEVKILLSDLSVIPLVDLVVPPSVMLPLVPAAVLKSRLPPVRSLVTSKLPLLAIVTAPVPVNGPPMLVPPLAPVF